ncbi:rhamnulokinase family protein [Catellatospora sp. KI3]|uniref:rhamnulokinase n=1 Tax=Catellatospora sp. KI3 TaxID=3041620 RepID=UPI002482E8F2|nr:rhamnulokinase family protein [Catellatospora sp. KI3]MDI1463524.1 rhamnulokinase family protein [Catellatospora sp. KI3]
MATVTVAAADLGASSGRVILAQVGPDRLDLTEVHRFTNRPVRLGATLHWDALALYQGVLDGLTAAARTADGLDGIGIDSWAVDYGLLDGTGALIGNPVSYRDRRTAGVMEAVHAQVGAQHLYRTTGLQNLPFNTVYQLVAARDTPAFAQARRVLLLPDLLAYWLTGNGGAEITNASTTGLLDATSRTWSRELLAALGLDPALLGRLRQPGEEIGRLLPAVAEETGLSSAVPVIAVGSHDTASAVAAVPAATPRFAYVSCGTWSLVGVELRAPVLSEASRAANFTNETGVDGTVRYLRNVMGLWLLQESVRTWDAAGTATDLDALLRAAAGEPALAAVIDPDDPVFLPPGDMPARIREACRRTGQPVPGSPAAVTRCILDSLALAHARAVRQARALSGQDVEVVHVVGGGARNALLCQLTADACGLPVLAGPVEATALGNTLVQARALGAVTGGLDELRGLVRAHTSVVAYTASGDAQAWQLAEARIHL